MTRLVGDRRIEIVVMLFVCFVDLKKLLIELSSQSLSKCSKIGVDWGDKSLVMNICMERTGSSRKKRNWRF